MLSSRDKLGYRPRRVHSDQGYDINGYTFYTEQQDDKSTVQNSGVTLIATTTDSSRMTIAKNSYYGVVDEIWELDYTSVVIPLLKCKWVDNTRGVKVDSDGFTCVNLSTNGYLSDPFILAKQATQVFYVKDPKDKRWHIVLQSKRSIVGVDDVVDEDEYNKFDELPPFSIGVQSTDDVLSDTLYLRSDHQEGHGCENHDPPEPRTRRGINRIQDLPVGESVEFNQFGQAVGKWQYLYGKYLGTRTRRLISILKKNWKQVTKEEKNFLWSDIKAHFRLENDDVKKRTLVSCGTKWKAFKTKLRVKFMVKNVSPLQKWTFIQPNVWEELCQNENTPEKMYKLRAQASEQGKKHISQPGLGSKGYRGFELQWQEERNDPDKATELHLIPDIHGSNYCLARAPRDKYRIKTLPPELIDVSNNLLAQGSNESKAGVDPLILVLGPEHGGRTRGVGCDIGYKKGIEGYVRKKRTYEQRKDIEEIRNEVRQQMKEELESSDFWEEIRAELKAELRNEMQPEHNLFSPREDDVPNSVHMKSSLNSTTIMVRNGTQAQQNESFSQRQEGNHSSIQMRSNLSSTKSIRRKEQQGKHNELISTRQVNVPSSVQRRSNLSSTTSIIRQEHQGE
ncbi:ulp1 protease family, C-terminal catalytic domain-containing protein [Tanacetum coccineum]